MQYENVFLRHIFDFILYQLHLTPNSSVGSKSQNIYISYLHLNSKLCNTFKLLLLICYLLKPRIYVFFGITGILDSLIQYIQSCYSLSPDIENIVTSRALKWFMITLKISHVYLNCNFALLTNLNTMQLHADIKLDIFIS